MLPIYCEIQQKENAVKTKLIFEPKSEQLKQLDEKIVAYVTKIQNEIAQTTKELGYSIYDGATSYIALLENEPIENEQITPFRTIAVQGMNGIVETSMTIEELGFTCINKNDPFPTQGYDCLFVLK